MLLDIPVGAFLKKGGCGYIHKRIFRSVTAGILNRNQGHMNATLGPRNFHRNAIIGWMSVGVSGFLPVYRRRNILIVGSYGVVINLSGASAA